MKLGMSLILMVVMLPAFSKGVTAQSASSAASAADELRAQLLDVKAKETELQARALQLDEDMKPENIARSLAGIGSTRPEELRELRRRQLTIEKEGVLAQLKLVATSRERLEAAIRTADAQAYQQSAAPLNQVLGTHSGGSQSRLLLMLAGLIAAIGLVVAIAAIRRLSI